MKFDTVSARLNFQILNARKIFLIAKNVKKSQSIQKYFEICTGLLLGAGTATARRRKFIWRGFWRYGWRLWKFGWNKSKLQRLSSSKWGRPSNSFGVWWMSFKCCLVRSGLNFKILMLFVELVEYFTAVGIGKFNHATLIIKKRLLPWVFANMKEKFDNNFLNFTEKFIIPIFVEIIYW